MNNKNIPTYQGISFQVPDYPDSQRIDESLEKIISKTRETSERTGKTKEELYEEIGFDPEIFVDDYSRNFGYFEDLMSPEEASDYVTSKLDELVDDPDPEENKIKKYGNKIKNFFSGKGFAFLAAGALLGATALSGCVGDAVAPSLPEHDGEVDIANNPEEVITVDDEPGDADYTTIRDGIDAAEPGGLVRVRGGNYAPVFLRKQLTLKGVKDLKDNEPMPIIDEEGHYLETCIAIRGGEESIIDGFWLSGGEVGGLGNAVALLARSGGTVIKNNIIVNSRAGIEMGSSQNEIYNNKIINNTHGIEGYFGSGDHIISDNLIKNSKTGVLLKGTHNVLKGNDIVDNDKGVVLKRPLNTITNNNFIENEKQADFFYYMFSDFFPVSNWNRNYWSDWDSRTPRPIHGIVTRNFRRPRYHCTNYDWFPRQEPKGPTGYKNSFEGDGTGDAKTLISEASPSTDIPQELLDSEIAKNSLDEPDLVTDCFPIPFRVFGHRPTPGLIGGIIKNVGSEESEPTNLTYEIYSLLSINPEGPMLPLTKIKEFERSVEGLSPGEETTFVTGPYQRPCWLGLFLTKATIDPEHNVDESNELNNVDRDIYASSGIHVIGGRDWCDWWKNGNERI